MKSSFILTILSTIILFILIFSFKLNESNAVSINSIQNNQFIEKNELNFIQINEQTLTNLHSENKNKLSWFGFTGRRRRRRYHGFARVNFPIPITGLEFAKQQAKEMAKQSASDAFERMGATISINQNPLDYIKLIKYGETPELTKQALGPSDAEILEARRKTMIATPSPTTTTTTPSS